MKLFVVISLAALLAGCATPNDAVSNKSSSQHGNAAIRYNPESVQMVSIDGKAYPRPTLAQAVVTGQPDTYVTPGKHKIGCFCPKARIGLFQFSDLRVGCRSEVAVHAGL